MVFTSTEADAPDGPKVLLEQGELLVEVTRSLGRKKMTVQTPLGTAVAESENTSLHVSEAAGVAVVRGEVHFVHAASGKSIRLRGGQYVVATPEGQLYAAQLFSGEGNVWTRFHYASFTDVPGVAFSPDGAQLAAVTRSAEDGLRLGPVGGPLPLDLAGDSCLAFSPDGRLVATADHNNVILYDAADGRQVQVLPHPQRNPRVVRLVFAPDGKSLAIGRGGWRDPGLVEVWDLATGTQRAAWRSHAQGINALAFSPDGKLLASASTDMTVALWNMETMQEESKILNVSGLVPLALAFSPDGKTLSVGTGPRDFRVRRPGEIQLWEVETRMLRGSLRGHGRAVTSLAYSADGRTLVSGSADTTVRFWDLPAGREYGMLKGHQAAVGFEGLAVALSADGRWLATASMDRTVKLWKLAGTKGPVAPTAARILPDHGEPPLLARWRTHRHRSPDA
jgi:WD40 repeat protein